MEAAVSLVTIVCYGGAFYLWWQTRTPLVVMMLLAGHLGSLVSPLWSLLYRESYSPDLTVQYSLVGYKLLRPIVVASAWYYTIPAVVVFSLSQGGWWRATYLNVLMLFGGCLLYHAALEQLGLLLNIWDYHHAVPLPFGLTNWVLSSLMAAIISLVLIYVLFFVHRYVRHPWYSMAMIVLPAPLLTNVVVRGLLGGPIWITALFGAQGWAATMGVLLALALLVWAIHIIAGGMARLQQAIVV